MHYIHFSKMKLLGILSILSLLSEVWMTTTFIPKSNYQGMHDESKPENDTGTLITFFTGEFHVSAPVAPKPSKIHGNNG